VVAVVGDI